LYLLGKLPDIPSRYKVKIADYSITFWVEPMWNYKKGWISM